MKTLILILALAFTASAQQPPEDWQFLAQGMTKDGVFNTFIAPSTIARNDDKVKVWIRLSVVYGYPLRFADRSYIPRAKDFKAEVFLDCKAKTVKNGLSFLYDSSDTLLAEYKEREKVKEKPGTVSWTVFEYFCEKEGKKLTGPPVLK